MNPTSIHEIGQATHREYESNYGQRYSGEIPQQVNTGTTKRVKRFLTLSGSAAVAILAAAALLF